VGKSHLFSQLLRPKIFNLTWNPAGTSSKFGIIRTQITSIVIFPQMFFHPPKMDQKVLLKDPKSLPKTSSRRDNGLLFSHPKSWTCREVEFPTCCGVWRGMRGWKHDSNWQSNWFTCSGGAPLPRKSWKEALFFSNCWKFRHTIFLQETCKMYII